MKVALTLLAAAGLSFPAGVDLDELRTDYTHGETLRIVRETSVTQETTDMAMERDGEPIEHPGSFGGGERTAGRTLVWLDTVSEHAGGAPTEVTRVFEGAEASYGEDGESEESPLDGETVTLTLDDDGEVFAEADGVDDEVLAGQRLELPLDALLPEDDVSAGDSWEIEGEALLSALGIDVVEALFPRPEVDWEAMRGERGRGQGGPVGMMRRDSSTRLLLAAEWDASATLTDEVVVVDGVEALVIELSLEGEGELEDEAFGGGRRRDRSTGAPGSPSALPSTPVLLLSTDFEIDLEGRLLFSVEVGRPLSLEVEGTYFMETETVRDMGDFAFSMYRAQEGTFEQTVTITVEE